MENQDQPIVQMTNPKATHISLVERGANQMPFKVIKSDKTGDSKMKGINLSRIVKSAIAMPATEVVGVVVPAGASLTQDHLTALGVSTVVEVKKAADTGDVGDIHIIQKSAFSENEEDGNLFLVELSPEQSVVCKSFRPYNEEFTSNATFGEIIKARTIPIYRIGDVIAEMLSEALYNASDKSEAVTAAAGILEDAKTYVGELFNALPDAVFKSAQTSVTKSAEAGEAPEAGKQGDGNADNPQTGGDGSEANSGNGTDPAGTVPAETQQGAEGENGDGAAEPTPAVEAAPESTPEVATEPATDPVPVTKEPTTDPAPVEAPVLDVNALSSSIVEQVTKAFQPKFDDMDQRLQSIAKTATDVVAETNKVLGSTVISQIHRTDNPVQKSAVNTQESEQHMTIDTAYGRPQL